MHIRKLISSTGTFCLTTLWLSATDGCTRFHHLTSQLFCTSHQTSSTCCAGAEGGHCQDECHLNSSAFMSTRVDVELRCTIRLNTELQHFVEYIPFYHLFCLYNASFVGSVFVRQPGAMTSL